MGTVKVEVQLRTKLTTRTPTQVTARLKIRLPMLPDEHR
jgi:hypothetical protein